MKEQTLDEKIKALKKKTKGYNPEAIAIVDEWEDKYARLNAQAEWIEHPNTKELLALALEQIASIDSLLSEKEDITMDDRMKLFALKKAHLVYVSVLSANPESEIKSIESSVDYELTNNQDE